MALEEGHQDRARTTVEWAEKTPQCLVWYIDTDRSLNAFYDR